MVVQTTEKRLEQLKEMSAHLMELPKLTSLVQL